MKNIVIIVGTRPNFIKAFPVREILSKYYNVTLIHTGQHYDSFMSDIFFHQLNCPKPDIHISLLEKTRAGKLDNFLYSGKFNKCKIKQTIKKLLIEENCGKLSEIRNLVEKELIKINPDLLLVFGDVTSTIASALAGYKLNIPIGHIESGLRSEDLKMPEEVNRILCDSISDIFFVTENSAIKNLYNSGINKNIFLVGNTMIDTQTKFINKINTIDYYKKLNLTKKQYVLVTLHRPSNVDCEKQLKKNISQLASLNETIIYPIHPRTKLKIQKLNLYYDNIKIIDPLGYFEFTSLMMNSKYVITDSGGIQEETTSLFIPCYTLRKNTERPYTLRENYGTNKLISSIDEIDNYNPEKNNNYLWDGKASNRILNQIDKFFRN
ncbi:MAG: UDP-N-acetylglucosamine 2-epimerase (non-hydrolyzing) [Magnetococcales bacterium]|nr:UDP-N-acetylglucosamine 2-epimerase (non-hydrolyzing) [Magnetococcales bacterium]|tara:strand:+ start:114454 stop:115593 length:1140 start_codon:yes stop_codon:yes gene_type:complete